MTTTSTFSRSRMDKYNNDNHHSTTASYDHDDDDSLSFGSTTKPSNRSPMSQESLFQQSNNSSDTERNLSRKDGSSHTSNNDDKHMQSKSRREHLSSLQRFDDGDCNSSITTTMASQSLPSQQSSVSQLPGSMSTSPSCSRSTTASTKSHQSNQTYFRSTGQPRTKNQRLRALQATSNTTSEERAGHSSSVSSTTSSKGCKKQERPSRFHRPPTQQNKNDISSQSRRQSSQDTTKSKKQRILTESQPPPLFPPVAADKTKVIPASEMLRKNTQHNNMMERSRNKTNVFAMLDFGNQQILHDECIFLCSNITANSALTSMSSRITAAVELLQLLSSNANRRTLFVSDNIQKETSALSTILNTWIWMCQYRRRNDDDDGLGNHQTSLEHDATTPSCQTDEDETSWMLLQNIILACWHYISMDCTMECSASFHKARFACQMRMAILQYPDCIASLFQWIQNNKPAILLQSRPKEIRGSSSTSTAAPNARRLHSDALNLENDQFSPLSQKSTTSTATTNSSKSCRSQLDPTVAGRRRQKQHQVQCGRKRVLDTIIEEGTKTDIKKDIFAFSQRSRSPIPSTHYGTDEFVYDDKNGSKLSFSPSSAETTELQDWPIRKASDIYESIASKIFCEHRKSHPPQHKISESSKKSYHTCETMNEATEMTDWTRTVLPLIAIQRIVSGKMEGSDVSCIDEELGKIDKDQAPSFSQNSDINNKRCPVDDNDDNPLLLTNQVLAENGCLPSLSQSLADTLAEVVRLLETSTTERECHVCLGVLQDRVTRLGALVDGASLWSASNRRSLSEEGFHDHAGGYLIVGLVAVLRCFLKREQGNGHVLFYGGWGDIALSVLRTLTSLTHENEIAAKELEAPLTNTRTEVDESNSGLDIVSKVLYAAAVTTLNDEESDNKLRYDSIIFCLNILTNVIESGASRHILEKIAIKVRDGEKKHFLSWLTGWLVNETCTFQDAVAESKFGSEPSKHAERRLASHETEKLVTAGNGFVLLSCLLLDNGAEKVASLSYDIILREIPGDSQDTKILFMRNTLKAFCNFYHFTVGDLSVAVVAPVKTLILRLEKLQEYRSED